MRSATGSQARSAWARLPGGPWEALPDGWTYEWGSHAPCFGLFGVDHERGVRWSGRDSIGDDSAGAYRQMISGLRRGDRSELA
jgi:hypothetical protein